MRVRLLLTRLLRTLEPLGAGARPHLIRVGGTFLAICENVRVGRVLTGIYFTWKLPLRVGRKRQTNCHAKPGATGSSDVFQRNRASEPLLRIEGAAEIFIGRLNLAAARQRCQLVPAPWPRHGMPDRQSSALRKVA
jgi:hypothetical protein